jgi:hypothetical protein
MKCEECKKDLKHKESDIVAIGLYSSIEISHEGEFDGGTLELERLWHKACYNDKNGEM